MVNITFCFDKSHFRFTFATITTRVARWSDVESGRSVFRDKKRPRRVLRWKKFTIPMLLLYALSGPHIWDLENVRNKFALVENFTSWKNRLRSTVLEKYIRSDLSVINFHTWHRDISAFLGTKRSTFLIFLLIFTLIIYLITLINGYTFYIQTQKHYFLYKREML